MSSGDMALRVLLWDSCRMAHDRRQTPKSSEEGWKLSR